MSPTVKESRTEQNTVCFSGHRFLSGTEQTAVRRLLRRAVRDCWEAGYRWFICGGALGFDTLAAEAVIAFRDGGHPNAGLFLAIPCADQTARWQEPDRLRYQRIRQAADGEIVLSPRYFPGCMQLRNQYMVHHASLCVCYLRRFSGGTGYTVRYALSQDRRIVNLCVSDDSVMIKEPSWNSTSISPSAFTNAPTARSIRWPAGRLRRWKTTCLRSSGKPRGAKNT